MLPIVTREQFCAWFVLGLTMVSTSFYFDSSYTSAKHPESLIICCCFTSLVDQLKACTTGIDPIYFPTRFIDGLHYELSSVLLVQRPQKLDAVCTLALLQEEARGSRDSARVLS